MSKCPPLLLPVPQNNTAARQPHLEEEITPGGVHPERGTRPKPGREQRAGEGGGQRSRGRSAPTAATKTQSAACNAAGARRSVNGNIILSPLKSPLLRAAVSSELVWRAATGADQMVLKMRQNGWYHA